MHLENDKVYDFAFQDHHIWIKQSKYDQIV